ncbi:MAG: sensor histidine kinase [Rivularia sp. (in: Bacteria)]|nr:sensor histidine kinase [Rivularia sp. MS3]
MLFNQTASSSIRRTVSYVEWLILFVYFLLFLLNRSETNYSSLLIPTYFRLTQLIVLTGLSFIFPINGSMWQRRIYIYLELFIIIIPASLGIYFEIALYFILLKSCFLLKRKEVIITTIILGIIWTFAKAYSIPKILEFNRANLTQIVSELDNTNLIVSRVVIDNIADYLTISVFVLFFSFVIVAEQRSRRKAEALTQQIETLAANLERSRIAREIHDSLGHSLTTLDIQLELAQRLYDKNPHKAIDSLNIAKDLSSECLTKVRNSVKSIRQTDFNLNQALATLVEQVVQNQSFVIHLNSELPQLPIQTSHQLYCIVQEAVTNIQKHGFAKVVKIKGYQDNQGIILEIIDDGQGFEVNAHHTGFGLRGMHERVQILGGELQIKSTLGKGTQIKVWIPG